MHTSVTHLNETSPKLPGIDSSNITIGKKIAENIRNNSEIKLNKIYFSGKDEKSRFSSFLEKVSPELTKSDVPLENYNQVVAVVIHELINQGNKNIAVKFVSALKDIQTDSKLEVDNKQFDLSGIKKELTRYILTKIHSPRFVTYADLEVNFGRNSSFLRHHGLNSAYEKQTAKHLVEIAFPGCLDLDRDYKSLVRPWMLQEAGQNNNNKLIGQAIAHLLIYDLQAIADGKIDYEKLKTVSWQDKIRAYGLGINGQLIKDIIQLGINELTLSGHLRSNIKLVPILSKSKINWKEPAADGTLPIDAITAQIMLEQKESYSKSSGGQQLSAYQISQLPWATLYCKKHGTCLRFSELTPVQALTRVFGHEIFGWDSNQVLPEYCQQMGQSKTDDPLKIKLCHGLHKTGLGHYKDGTYTFSLKEFASWIDKGTFKMNTLQFISFCKIGTETVRFKNSISDVIYWLITDELQVPEVDRLKKFPENLKSAVGKFAETKEYFIIKFNESYKNSIRYSPNNREVAEVLRDHAELKTVKDLNLFFKVLAVQANPDFTGIISIPNFMIETALKTKRLVDV